MYRSQLMAALDIHNVAGLVRYAVRMGMITPDASAPPLDCLSLMGEQVPRQQLAGFHQDHPRRMVAG